MRAATCFTSTEFMALFPFKKTHINGFAWCSSTNIHSNFLLQHFYKFITATTKLICYKKKHVSVYTSHFHSSCKFLQLWIILIVSGAANQAELWKHHCASALKLFWCAGKLSSTWSQTQVPSNVFLCERLTFVVVPLCVHPVQTVKQPIDLRLYQNQLLFNHLQLLHAHWKKRGDWWLNLDYRRAGSVASVSKNTYRLLVEWWKLHSEKEFNILQITHPLIFNLSCSLN